MHLNRVDCGGMPQAWKCQSGAPIFAFQTVLPLYPRVFGYNENGNSCPTKGYCRVGGLLCMYRHDGTSTQHCNTVHYTVLA
jgi:hypothetical protein